MQRPMIIAPSILSADFAALGQAVIDLEKGGGRLDPCRRHGWAFRTQSHHWSPGRQSTPPDDQASIRCSSDDRVT